MYTPPPPITHHLDRPPPSVLPVGSASDDSISTVATTASSDSTIFPFNRSTAFTNSPYSSLVYTPPARQKDQYIDDEAILSRRFDGLGIRERAEAELAAKRYGEVEAESFEFDEEAGSPPPLPASISTFAFPNSHPVPPRHTSLPSIVTSATHFAGLSSTSPIDTHSHSSQSPASILSSAFPIATSSASLIGSALSLTPEASPGHSPTLSSVPSFPASSSSDSRYLPFSHHRSSTTSSGSSGISPRTALSTTTSGMARSGSTPNATTSSSSLQSPIARSASSHLPPWAIATAGTRPGSAGTSSTNRTSSSSTRPWVFDSDASSVCSVNSGGWCSAGSSGGNGKRDQKSKVNAKDDGEEFEGDEGGEVFKAEGDVEFLDHRPEPQGAKLSINRDDPSQVVLKVTLPGFSLDNITVAMRRGHKVHIVADSYGETGGHFEKLIHLGSDVSSVAPRAEFNGTDLNVYIQRRPSRPNSAASTAGSSTNGSNPFGIPPGSPGSTFSSPDLDHRRPSIASSLASAWSSTGSNAEDGAGGRFPQPPYPLSPSLEYPSPTSSTSDSYLRGERERRISQDIPPPFTVIAPPLTPSDPNYRKSKSSKSLTGPEGAKAAAKAAREEAAKRAKEEAKKLPSSAKGGRRLPFRRQKEDGSYSEGSGSNSSASDDGLVKAALQYTSLPQSQSQSQVQQEGKGIDRNGTIKANSRSNSPLPPSSTSTTSTSTSSSSSSVSSDSAFSSASTSPNSSPPRNERPLPLFTNPSNPHHTHPRPKMREGNLTLRAPDGMSFVSQAQREWSEFGRNGRDSTREEGEFGEQEGESLTPRWEEKGMRFTSSSGTA